MAELVDAYVSGAYIERCAGSTPVRGTKSKVILIDNQSVRVFLFLSSQVLSRNHQDGYLNTEKIVFCIFHITFSAKTCIFYGDY